MNLQKNDVAETSVLIKRIAVILEIIAGNVMKLNNKAEKIQGKIPEKFIRGVCT